MVENEGNKKNSSYCTGKMFAVESGRTLEWILKSAVRSFRRQQAHERHETWRVNLLRWGMGKWNCGWPPKRGLLRQICGERRCTAAEGDASVAELGEMGRWGGACELSNDTLGGDARMTRACQQSAARRCGGECTARGGTAHARTVQIDGALNAPSS